MALMSRCLFCTH